MHFKAQTQWCILCKAVRLSHRAKIWRTRKSSCVNATRHTSCRVVTTPSVVLNYYRYNLGMANGIKCWGDTLPGYPPSWPGPDCTIPECNLSGRIPPGFPRGGGANPQLDLVGYTNLLFAPKNSRKLHAKHERILVPPPRVCPMAFWEMLQNIMGYGPPPCRSARWYFKTQTHVIILCKAVRLSHRTRKSEVNIPSYQSRSWKCNRSWVIHRY